VTGFPAHRQAPQSWWPDRREICRRSDRGSRFCAGSMLADPDKRRVEEEL